MPSDEGAPDSRALLMERVAVLAGQIFCARAGEPLGNRSYGAVDAMRDASRLLTIALNAGEVQRFLDDAAKSLQLPTVWPTASPEASFSPEEPFSTEVTFQPDETFSSEEAC